MRSSLPNRALQLPTLSRLQRPCFAKFEIRDLRFQSSCLARAGVVELNRQAWRRDWSYAKTLVKDPWGRAYIYEYPGRTQTQAILMISTRGVRLVAPT
jgi:hypothetical protein